MITLEVEEYCHDCGDFSPEAQILYANNTPIQTKVHCRHAAFCRRMRNRLKEKAEREVAKNEKVEFACRVCFEKLKKDNPQAIDCAWRGLDNEYCPELKKILEREDAKQ